MNDPLVSVIVPLYNAEKYITDTITSIINQSYKNWELIIINDGSTDDSLSVARKYQSDKIKVFSQYNNGASVARNYGLREAKGGFIQFLDADDLLSENKIEEQVKLLNLNPGKIAYCPTVHFFDCEDYLNRAIVNEIFHINHESPVEFLINLYGGYTNKGGMVTIHSWLTPRSVINKAGWFNETLNPNPDDDGEFFCRVILNSEGVVYTEKAINYYRKFKNSNNLSGQRSRIAMESILKSAQFKKEYLLSKTDNPYAKKALARMFKEIEVSTFPYFIDLSKQSSENVKYLGGTQYTPAIGGFLIESIRKILGWKIAKRIQFQLNQIKN